MISARRAIAALLILTATASAQDLQPTFQMPSGNIFCQVFESDGGSDAELRCDLMEHSNPTPPAPADCDLDWGHAFVLGLYEGTASRVCAGDTVRDPAMPVLEYDEAWEYGDYFRCTAERAGLTCINQFGNGFFLSRNAQKLY